jgi:hypothetical protein
MKELQEVIMQEGNELKIFYAQGLWWPTLHKDAKEFFRLVMFVRDLGSLLGGMRCC